MDDSVRGDTVLSCHRETFGLATSYLPVDEAIVTFPLQPSLTKQVRPAKAGPYPYILEVLARADAPIYSKWISTIDHGLNSTEPSTQFDLSLACRSSSLCSL